MRKTVKIIFLSIIGLLLLALLVAYFSLGRAVKSAITSYGPKITQTPVSVGSASVSPFSGSGTLRDVVIGNPAGYKNPYSLNAGSIHIQVLPSTLFSDPLVIQDLTIDSPALVCEMGLGSTNVDCILGNVRNSLERQDSKSSRKVVIRHFSITNAKLSLGVALVSGTTPSVPLPDLELSDIGAKNGGITTAEAMLQILDPLSRDLTSASTSLLRQNAGGMLKEGFQNVKGFLGSKLKPAEQPKQ